MSLPRLLLVSLALALVAGACGSSEPSDAPAASAAPSANMAPTLPPAPAVSDDFSGRTLTDLEESVAALEEAQTGFERHTIVTEEGYGSFSIVLPVDWAAWFTTDDPLEVVGHAVARDPLWGRVLDVRLGTSNQAPTEAIDRAVFVNTVARPLAAIAVDLTRQAPITMDELVISLEEGLGELGGEVLEMQPAPTETGGRVTVLVSFAEDAGFVETLVERTTFVLDNQNGYLWSVSCTHHESIDEALAGQCSDVSASFQPFGPVVS